MSLLMWEGSLDFLDPTSTIYLVPRYTAFLSIYHLLQTAGRYETIRDGGSKCERDVYIPTHFSFNHHLHSLPSLLGFGESTRIRRSWFNSIPSKYQYCVTSTKYLPKFLRIISQVWNENTCIFHIPFTKQQYKHPAPVPFSSEMDIPSRQPA